MPPGHVVHVSSMLFWQRLVQCTFPYPSQFSQVDKLRALEDKRKAGDIDLEQLKACEAYAAFAEQFMEVGFSRCDQRGNERPDQGLFFRPLNSFQSAPRPLLSIL